MRKFPKDFWKASQTEIQFISSSTLPKNLSITAVSVWCFKNKKVLLVHVPRGWGTIAGHIEKGETPEDAGKREAFEEAGLIINRLILIGYLKTKKIQENELNRKYPLNGGIPVYVSNEFSVNSSVNLKHESINRKFVSVDKLDEDLVLSKMMKAIMYFAYKSLE